MNSSAFTFVEGESLSGMTQWGVHWWGLGNYSTFVEFQFSFPLLEAGLLCCSGWP